MWWSDPLAAACGSGVCPQEGLRGQVRVLQQLEFNVMPGTSDDDDDDGKKAIDEAGDGVRHVQHY